MGYRAHSQQMGGYSEPDSQAWGSKLWWGTSIPEIIDRDLQLHHLQLHPLTGEPFLLLVAQKFVPDQD